jgi:N-acetylneuraminic acid mutarotase
MFRLLRHRPAVFVIAAIVLLCSAAAFTQTRWMKAAPFPEPDEELYGVTVNGNMVVMGGFGNARGKNYEYDPAADKWTKKAPMPRPAHHQAMIEYRGKIYVFGGFVAPMTGPQGGWEPIDNAWVYDPAADSWNNLAPMPLKRGSALAVQVNGKVYVIGGATTADGSKDVAISGATSINNLTRNDVYDIASNTWSTAAPMALGRNHMFGGTVNGKIYVIGGRTAHAFVANSQNTDVVEEYDPATNTWGTQRAKMPTARSGGGWATYGGKIYVGGGEVATTSLVGAFRALEAYDPATNTWSILPSMPMPRHGVAGAVIGNKLHFVSGMITSAAAGAGQDRTVEVHVAQHDVLELPMAGTN